MADRSATATPRILEALIERGRLEPVARVSEPTGPNAHRKFVAALFFKL